MFVDLFFSIKLTHSITNKLTHHIRIYIYMYRKHASSRAPQQVALGDDSLIHAIIHLFFSNVLLVKRRSLYLFFLFDAQSHLLYMFIVSSFVTFRCYSQKHLFTRKSKLSMFLFKTPLYRVICRLKDTA